MDRGSGFARIGSAALELPYWASGDLSASAIWRSTSLVMAIVMIGHHWFTLHRFLRTSGKPPLRFLINSGITLIIVFVLLANAVEFPFEPHLGPVAAGATLRLFIGAEIFMLTFEDFFDDSKSAKRK